jgi:hypothetical protein
VKSKTIVSAGHVAYNEGNKKEYPMLVGKPVTKQSFRRPGKREGN